MLNNIRARQGAYNVSRHRVRVVLALLVTFVVSSCSMVRISYEAAPLYASWQLDRYWSLDSTQSAFGKDRIAEQFRWHRRSELPEYARWLRQVNERSQGSIDLAEAASWRRVMTGFWTKAVHRLAPDLTELLITLQSEQVERMNKRMATENNDYRKEYLPDDLSEREARRIKRIEARIESYLGGITEKQQEIVRKMARLMPQNEQVWYQERLARQKDWAAVMERARLSGQKVSDVARRDTTKQITEYLLSIWEPNDAQRRQRLENVMRASDEIMVEVLNAATPTQKATLSRRLLGWAEDFEALAQ